MQCLAREFATPSRKVFSKKWFPYPTSNVSRRGSSKNCKMSAEGTISKGGPGACPPGKCYQFYLPKVPFPGFLSQSGDTFGVTCSLLLSKVSIYFYYYENSDRFP